MVSLKEAVGVAAKNVVCDLSTGANNFYGLLSNFGLPTATGQYITEKIQGFSCNKDSPDLSNYGTPAGFSGGQCMTLYDNRVTVTYNRTGATGQVFEATGQSMGPITSYRTEVQDLGGGSERVRVFAVSNGTETLIGQSNVGANIEVTDVDPDDPTPAAGGPNDCGDPPAQDPTPVETIEDTVDLVYTDDQGQEVTLANQPITVGPLCVNLQRVGFRIKIQTPFGPQCGIVGIELEPEDLIIGNSPVSPDFRFGACEEDFEAVEQAGAEEKKKYFSLDPPEGFTGSPTDPELQGSNTVELDPDVDPILAVFVQSARVDFSNDAGKTRILPRPGQTYPMLVVNYVALARFKIATEQEDGTITYGYTEDIRVKSEDAYIQCPAEQGAVDVEVVWEQGWQGTYVGARRKTCCSSCEDQDPRDSAGNIDPCDLV